jgi:hypothetical protein
MAVVAVVAHRQLVQTGLQLLLEMAVMEPHLLSQAHL